MDSPACTTSPAGHGSCGVPSVACDLRLDTPRDPARAAGASAAPVRALRSRGDLGPDRRGELWLGFDPSLRRHVWIHTLPPGAAAMAPLIRDLSRPARLRWLSGRRSTSEAWDAYEALDGVPLATLLDAPRPWRMVRTWLLDLAREIDAGLKDGSVAALTIDHVWITRDGLRQTARFLRAGRGPPPHEPGRNRDPGIGADVSRVHRAQRPRRTIR